MSMPPNNSVVQETHLQNFLNGNWSRQIILDLLNRLKNTIMLTDSERKIYWVNKTFEDLSGYTLAEIFGKAPHEFLFDPYTCEPTIQTSSVQLKCYHRSGSIFWLRVEISPILNEQQNVTGYTSIGNDITETINQQVLLVEQNNTLKDVAFTSSHVIRAPVANILSLTSLLKMEPQNEKVIGYIEESARKLDEHIQQMIGRITEVYSEQ